MKTNRKVTVLGLLVLGLMVAGFNAKAADTPAFQGKFTLTSATRWGQATLPVGDYCITLDKDYPGSVVTVYRGTKTVARIMTVGMSSMKAGRSQMVMEVGTVRWMILPQIGVNLHFAVPNSGHRSAPQEPQAAQIIPIAAVGVGR